MPSQTIEMVTAPRTAFGADMLVKLHPASDTARIRSAASADVRFDGARSPRCSSQRGR